MTCDEYLSILATAPVDQLGESSLRAHADECASCERVTVVVAEREASLLSAFERVSSSTPATITARVAATRSRRRRIFRMVAVTVTFAVGSVFWYNGARLFLRGRAASHGVADMTEQVFLIRCLSSAQMAVVRQYLGPEARLVYTGELPRAALTVRAPAAQIERLKSVLEQYEGSGSSACPANVGPIVPGDQR